MTEEKVAEIHDYLVRRIPDVRVTSHYDFDHWRRHSMDRGPRSAADMLNALGQQPTEAGEQSLR